MLFLSAGLAAWLLHWDPVYKAAIAAMVVIVLWYRITRELLPMWLVHAALLLQGVGNVAVAVLAAAKRVIDSVWARLTQRRRRASRAGAFLFVKLILNTKILAQCNAPDSRCHRHCQHVPHRHVAWHLGVCLRPCSVV